MAGCPWRDSSRYGAVESEVDGDVVEVGGDLGGEVDSGGKGGKVSDFLVRNQIAPRKFREEEEEGGTSYLFRENGRFPI